MINSLKQNGILRTTAHVRRSIIVSLAIVLCYTISFATGGTMSGNGTSGSPFIVQDYADLKAIGVGSDSLSKVYVLANDIDASASQTENAGAGFVPIGASATPFTGAFHGAGYVIRNLNINRSSTQYVGLVGYLFGGTIDSLGVVNANITGSANVGGVVGWSSGAIVNCFATGNVSCSTVYAGGVVGHNSGTMANCYSRGNVTGSQYIGGVAGYNITGTITNCYSIANVFGNWSGSSYVGGIVGQNVSNMIYDCYATGNVSGDTYVGGAVGYNSATVSKCYATGNVTGTTNDAAGIAGVNLGTIINCYATGNVNGVNFVGGIVGNCNGTQTVTDCYASGKITGSLYVGGIAGNINAGSFTNCYWNKMTTGTTSGFGSNSGTFTGLGLTTAQMRRDTSFHTWAFDTVWTIRIDTTYPYFRGLDNAPFAFADTLKTTRTFLLSKLLLNDDDPETGHQHLTLKITNASAGITDSLSSLTFPYSILNGRIDTITYRVGEIRTTDTLWGNIATAIVTLDTTFIVTSVSKTESLIPKALTLGNYPNPFNPTTTIQFSVEKDGKAVIKAFDLLGREVATLYDNVAQAGKNYIATFDGSRFASGVYLYSIESNNQRIVKKMLMLK
jgi:hypothetical protein